VNLNAIPSPSLIHSFAQVVQNELSNPPAAYVTFEGVIFGCR
jgi:hypothetical protein